MAPMQPPNSLVAEPQDELQAAGESLDASQTRERGLAQVPDGGSFGAVDGGSGVGPSVVDAWWPLRHDNMNAAGRARFAQLKAATTRRQL